MMEKLIEFISAHSAAAPWWIFALILLAGLNIPISIDVLVLASAVLAATVIPEKTIALFSSVFFGSVISAWVAYSMGRFLGTKVLKIPFFAKLLPQSRLLKMRIFYEKYGLLTMVIGRFIPFGFRNCLFMSTGMSKFPFISFVIRDAIACLLWSIAMFSLFYSLGQNYTAVLSFMKQTNLYGFGLIGMTGIGWIWYKRLKKKKQERENVDNR